MTSIETTKAPGAIGPYSQAVDTGAGLVFVSGQLPIDPSLVEIECIATVK